MDFKCLLLWCALCFLNFFLTVADILESLRIGFYFIVYVIQFPRYQPIGYFPEFITDKAANSLARLPASKSSLFSCWKGAAGAVGRRTLAGG
jgi:hypothetical protein